MLADPQPTRRRIAPGVVVVLLALTALAAYVVFVFVASFSGHSRESRRRASCLGNMKCLSLAMLNYARDYDDRLPPSTSWASTPYIASRQVLRCPEDGQHDLVSYNMPKRWSNASVADTPVSAELMVLLYESDAIGPAYRHNDGCNVAFVDGHVRWISQDLLTPEMVVSGSIPDDLWTAKRKPKSPRRP
ncbi:MAG: DUF1559 domain-containing protein [Armatimonadia bacterium]